MNYFHSRATFSFLQNEDDTRAVEHAVRTAIHNVLSVISSINSTKIQEYQSKLAEKDKENETLKRKVKTAEREITALRGSFEFSGNECHQVRSSTYALSPEMQRGKPICNENEVSSRADWRIDFPSLGGRTPPQVFSQCKDTALPTGASTIYMSHHQNPSSHSAEESGLLAERTRGQSPSPSPVTRPVIKEEPSDIETFYIKWEMSEEGIGEQREGLGPTHVLGKEYEAQQRGGTPTMQRDGTHPVAGSQSGHEYGERPTRHLKRRLSSAETQRRFRERVRADPEKFRAYKEKERRRNQQRKVSISDLPEETRRLKREAWREASRRCRARKMSSLQTNLTQPCHLSQNTETPGWTRGHCRGRQ
ncbi:uncharacterized protein [Salvelinus alpinus]|uniref:uncharacterized protein n=1 Tax=Salvelinus alpinus TaxID=8036 RepID=UPI0039FC1B30